MLGGSTLQLPIVKLAKSLKFSVILVDSNKDCSSRHLADLFLHENCENSREIIKFLSSIEKSYAIKGAYCGNDFGLISVAKINYYLGISPDLVLNTRNSLDKLKAKKILLETGILSPNLWTESAKKDILESDFPLIVKPHNSSGSRGVSFISEKKQLKPATEKALKYGKKFLVEEAILGRHIDVSGFFANGIFYPAGQLERFFTSSPYCIPTWGYQPPLIENKKAEEIYQLLEIASKALGITFGPVKADIIINETGSYIIEVTPRFHGEISTYYVANQVYNYDGIRSWFQFLKNSKISKTYNFTNSSKYSGWMAIFAHKVGELKSVHSKNLQPNVQLIRVKPNGTLFKSIDSNLGVIAFIVATANSPHEVKKILQQTKKEIKVRVI